MRELHTFAICAYQDSPYLEACIRSVTTQSQPTNVILCTSTPSAYIRSLAEQYRIPMYVREGESDIQADWNFAYEMADSRYVTIAHQDDLYSRSYVKTLARYLQKYPDTSLFTTDYVTVKDHQLVFGERLVRIKKLLRLPLRIPRLNHISWVKKAALCFGNSICCPACTYRKAASKKNGAEGSPKPFFDSECRFALDWDHLITMAEEPGRFICAEKPLVYHRLHKDAATNVCMKNSIRFQEEQQMFSRLWPEPAVRLLMKYYQKAYDSYEV